MENNMNPIEELQKLVDDRNSLEKKIKELSNNISEMLTEKLKGKEYYYQFNGMAVDEPNIKIEKVEITFTTKSFAISPKARRKLQSGKWSSKTFDVMYSLLEENPIAETKINLTDQNIF